MKAILDQLNIPYEQDVPLGERTWYRCGGRAELLAHPENVQQLAALQRHCHEKQVRTCVFGCGANLLVRDEGVGGIVIQLDSPGFRQLKIEGETVTVGAGYDLPKLVVETARHGLGGLDCLAGIPATVGGAVRMNAGGAYGDTGQSVRKVQVMDVTGHVYYRDRDDLVFSYRSSNIVARYILEVEFQLMAEEADELRRRVKEVFFFKKASQPLADRSAGCAFKNPLPPPDGPGGIAGKLIDDAGLKGFRIGGAEVSEQHANFIVTHEGCKAEDVLAVMEHVHQTVLAKHRIKLQREVVVWP